MADLVDSWILTEQGGTTESAIVVLTVAGALLLMADTMKEK